MKTDTIGPRSSTLHYNQDYRKITPTKNNVLVKDMEFGERMTLGGIIILDDDKKGQGIRPRWAEVVAVGRLQEDVKVGEYILVAHGRWTRGLDMTDEDGVTTTVRLVDPKDILMSSDEPPKEDLTFGINPTY
jgi:co-chaperonin GroES (HSP10)